MGVEEEFIPSMKELIQGLENIACMSLYESVEPGNICIEWQTLNDTGKSLIDT